MKRLLPTLIGLLITGVLTAQANLEITEIFPGQAGSDLTEDWFEISNTGTADYVIGVDPDLFYDDESADPNDAVLIGGLTIIPAGGTAIVVIGNAGDAMTFRGVWEAVIDLTGVDVGFADGGSGLGGGGDAVTIWMGDPLVSAASPLATGAYPDTGSNDGQTFDLTLAAFSVDGVGGAVTTLATAGSSGTVPNVGSPGNQGPPVTDMNVPTIIADSVDVAPLVHLTSTGPSAVGSDANDPKDPFFGTTIGFTLADLDTPLGDLVLSAMSDNQAVVADADLVLGGSGANRTLVVTATGAQGFATITLTVTDLDGNTDRYVINLAVSTEPALETSTTLHYGKSDASTAITTGPDHFWAGDDEDQTLRLFNNDLSGLPVNAFDLNAALGATDEVDIEGSFRIGSEIFWIGSHTNNARSVVFSTTETGSGENATLSLSGQFLGLRAAIQSWDANNDHGLGANFLGLNTVLEIEGMSADPLNPTGAFLGFRGPLVEGKALLVPVTNLTTIVSGSNLVTGANFGDPILLDLAGNSIRSIECGPNGCLIIGGPVGSLNEFRLWTWTGNPADAPELRSADLSALAGIGSIEGIRGLPAGSLLGAAADALEVTLVIDTGVRDYYGDGSEAKDLANLEWQKFRTQAVTLGEVTTPPDDFMVDITITEIMQNPSSVGDSQGEYFEVFNAGEAPVDMNGWTIFDDGSDSHLIDNGGPLEIAPGQYFVFARNADMATNGGFVADYEYGNDISLGNGADEIVLMTPGGAEVDRVNYDGGTDFPDPTGASMSLVLTSLDNNDGLNYCVATTSYGDGDLGTPGMANDCPVPLGPDLQVTEIWFGQDGTDLTADWFEITNFGDIAYSLASDGELYYDDDSQDPAVADLINGISELRPGESAVVVVDAESAVAEFISVWSPDYLLDGVQVGWADGSGLSGGGDGVSLFLGDLANNNLIDFEAYPAGTSGVSFDVVLGAESIAGAGTPQLGSNVAVATAAVGGENGDEPAVGSPGNLGPVPAALVITEIFSGQQGSDLTEDWFEITNTGTEPWISGVSPDLFYDDESSSPADARSITGITEILPGEYAIVVIGNETEAIEFADIWSEVFDLTDLEIGFTNGGAGLGGGGDSVTLWVGTPGVVPFVDKGGYPNTNSFDGQTYDIELGAFSVVCNDNDAQATVSTAGSTGLVPNIGSPGNLPEMVPPVLVLNDTILYLDQNGMAELRVEDFEYGATDNCGDPAITDISIVLADQAARQIQSWGANAGAKEGLNNSSAEAKALDQVLFFDCDDLENPNIWVSVTATDMAGNEATVPIAVTVLDTFAPTVVCSDLTVLLDENGFGGYTETDLFEATDNCDVDFAPFDIAFPLFCEDAGTEIPVDLRIADLSGNDTTCTVTVTVLDNMAPTIISCVTDTTIYLDENGFVSIAPGELLVTEDNCPPADIVLGDPLVAFDCDAAGESFTFNETDVDAFGNVSEVCAVNVTVLDTLAPTILTPNMLNLEILTSNIPEACPGSTFIQDNIVGQDRTVTEIIEFCNGLLVEGAGLDENFIMSLFDDNCTADGDLIVRVNTADSEIQADGSDLITLTGVLVDEAGNESVEDIVTVLLIDDIDPEVICEDVTVELDASGMASIADGDGFLIDGGASDNCELSISVDITEFTCDDIGDNTVTLTAIDGSGNEVSCDAMVTVEDNIVPIVMGIDQMVTLGDAMTSETFTQDDVLTIMDNCDVTVEFDRDLTFDGDDIGTTTVTATVTDAGGNVVVVMFDVIVGFEQPNLACITEINLTLNDNCQGLLIPQMLLTGNTDLLDAFNFDITVMDNDPSNGPIVDGCGRFQYSISSSDRSGMTTTGFTGDFSEANWDVNIGGDFATAVFTNETLTLTSGNGVFLDGDGVDDVTVSYQFAEEGDLAFDVDYSLETEIIEDILIIDFDGNIIFQSISDEGVTINETGSFSVAETVPAGSTLMIMLDGDEFTTSGVTSEVIVSNFSFSTGSVLGLDFETCWGYVNAEDKTPPAVVTTPDDVELLCVDIDDNTLTTLNETVNKCYRVYSATGATVPGSMATALRNRLFAGGSSPLVPLFTDGCTEEIEVCVNDVLVYDEEDPNCNDVVLTRTFTATEIAVCASAAGEENPSVTASYTITFSRPTLDDLSDDNIEDVVNYEQCGTANPTRADYPAPRTQDFPFLEIGDRTFNLSAGEAVCNIGVTYADGEAIVTCPFTYKFVRTYTVIDWCDPSDVRTFTQVVKVGDTTAPTFSGPTQDRDFDGVVDGDLIYTTNAGNVCAAYIRLDAGISAADNCSSPPSGAGGLTITATIYPGADLSATPIGAFDVDPTDNNAEVTSAIPVGCHLLRYTYTDACGNTDFSDYPFCVEDGTAPVAICEDGLNVSISSGSAAGGASTGIAILTPDMIDQGSYDDCSGVTLEIARVGADNIATEVYDQELVLTCADLGTVRVGLKVTDAEGNMNFCWLDVLVEDKNAPTCIAPGPVEISCIVARATLPDDIMEATEAELDATFGFATGIDNCEVTITSTISGNVNSCGVGSFTRIFTATDGEGFTNSNNCRQRITVYGIHDYRLTFPTDEEGTCADVPAYAGIAADEDACDLITTDVVVDTLRTLEAGEECFKLRVTYDVINWCEYNTLGQPYLIPRDGDGIRNPETQALYLNVNPGTDDQTTADDFAFLSRFADRSYNPNAPQRDQLLDDGDDTDGSDDDNSNDNDNEAYAADNSRGHFRYIQYIKIYDEVAPTIDADAPADCFAGTSLTCTAEVELTFMAIDECSEANVQIELDANYVAANGFNADNPAALGVGVSLSDDGMGGFTINATNVPVGNHAIRVRASDGCGNFDVEIIEFCVEGDKAPTPICIQTLTVTLMPTPPNPQTGEPGGMAAIWASDFIASDVEDCFGNVIDKYSIYTEEEAGAAGFAPAAGRLGIDLTCDDFGNDVPVRVYAIDNQGSADYCSVIVEVQAFQEGLCEGTGGNLAGNIATQDDDMMEGVDVNLTGAGDMDEMVTTAANGGYSFTNLPLGQDFTVEASYAPEVDLSQVKVSDVVKIGSVILGTSTFDNGYDFVAGDVDQDGSLSIFDMVAIQRVILGRDETFSTGDTWRFVTEEYDLTTSNWAAVFPEVYNVNNLAGVLSNGDFVGIQMGNVVREGGRSALNLETEEASLEAGQTHTMTITAANMLGFQGTIELAAGLELIDVTYEGEGGLNLNRAGEGLIGVALRNLSLPPEAAAQLILSEGNLSPTPLRQVSPPAQRRGAIENAPRFEGQAGLSITVRATEDGRLSELVSLTNDLVHTEGVDVNGASTGLGLAFNGSSLAPAVSALLQNTPNPVVEATTIRFELATAGRVTLSIQDAAGRVVLVRQLDAVAGLNRVDLTAKDLGAVGVLTYTLTAGDFAATKKMVVVR